MLEKGKSSESLVEARLDTAEEIVRCLVLVVCFLCLRVSVSVCVCLYVCLFVCVCVWKHLFFIYVYSFTSLVHFVKIISITILMIFCDFVAFSNLNVRRPLPAKIREGGGKSHFRRAVGFPLRV